MMAEDFRQRYTTEQRPFILKTSHQMNNQSETCRHFDEQFRRLTAHEAVIDIADRFQENQFTFYRLLLWLSRM